ncbi:hypothetical protein NLX83_00725 [Allokutzneria sp. A3M-2-11 16]|uniref:hypothetical protein n=1 Tax=Allokutzneria sp. A3M-2-11 16 TaxID=2962043 RepID=UPI0020B76824|nr:hypothetical protein [Allokutzneria sp. A3M-2-11 16]MCP3797772.1 hypothetical protein [Allokutzneria sp. A3M-2-11 16]
MRDQKHRLTVHMSLLAFAGFVATVWQIIFYAGRADHARVRTLVDDRPDLVIWGTIGAAVVGLLLGLIGGTRALARQRAIGGWLWAAWAPLYLVVLTTHLITLV